LLAPTNHCFQKSTLPVCCTKSKCLEVLSDKDESYFTWACSSECVDVARETGLRWAGVHNFVWQLEWFQNW
jgi:hypothetical protein